jgi:enoyl-CoA hydratase
MTDTAPLAQSDTPTPPLVHETAEFATRIDGAGIATMVLRKKTMGPEFFSEFETHLDFLENADLRCVIVRGADPKALSYGLDLPRAFGAWGELFRGSTTALPRRRLLHLIQKLQRPFNRLFALRVPTICAISGHCIGGGLDLASACDIRLASKDANISLRETRIAIVADLGSLQRLPPIIGQGRTRELAFTARDVTAEEALAMNLVNAVHPDADALFAAAQTMAEQIAANAPLTVEGVKVVLNRQVAAAIADGLDHVGTWNAAFLASEDLGEAASAFASRRPPRFKGR